MMERRRCFERIESRAMFCTVIAMRGVANGLNAEGWRGRRLPVHTLLDERALHDGPQA